MAMREEENIDIGKACFELNSTTVLEMRSKWKKSSEEPVDSPHIPNIYDNCDRFKFVRLLNIHTYKINKIQTQRVR
jgi:hypothetical protein